MTMDVNTVAFGFDPRGLLDLSKAWDQERVTMLDRVVSTLYQPSTAAQTRKIADDVLKALKENPDAWRLSAGIIELSIDPSTKHFALGILADAISSRWNTLSKEQQSSIRNFLVNTIIKEVEKESSHSAHDKHFLTKLNETLVTCVKQDWPTGWPTFVPELCQGSRTSQGLCANNLKILKLLSEEIFEFGVSSLTSRRVSELKASLTGQVDPVFDLCRFVLMQEVEAPGAMETSLLRTSLSTLSRFLKWAPLKYLFQTDLIDILTGKLWDRMELRIEILECLNEMVSVSDCSSGGAEAEQIAQEVRPHVVRLFKAVLKRMQELPAYVLTPSKVPPKLRLFWETFLNQLTLLLTTFLHHNVRAVEEDLQAAILALTYLAKLTEYPNEETFKQCVTFWQILCARLHLENVAENNGNLANQAKNFTFGVSSVSGEFVEVGGLNSQGRGVQAKIMAYRSVLSQVRGILIERMPKPPEVILRETEDGEMVREEEEDTEELALYRCVREALIYLTHLDSSDMSDLMTSKIHGFIVEVEKNNLRGEGKDWNHAPLDKVCWAVGSISGSMSEKSEKSFVIQVIRELLTLTELNLQRSSRAAVASNIMYVISQYPRFVKNHENFAKVVLKKLFDFMGDENEGVKEMAATVFMKITQKCSSSFVSSSSGPSILEHVLNHLPSLLDKLPLPVLCIFFEGVGYLIAELPREEDKLTAARKAVEEPLKKWDQVVSLCGSSPSSLLHSDASQLVSLVLRIHERLTLGMGRDMFHLIGHFYQGMLQIYKIYSEAIVSEVRAKQNRVQFEGVRALRRAKRDALRLVATFVDRSLPAAKGGVPPADLLSLKKHLTESLLPPLLQPVLMDFRESLPEARDPDVLKLMSVLACKLPEAVSEDLGLVYSTVIEGSISMVASDFHLFPDLRKALFELLRDLVSHCHLSFMRLQADQIKPFIDGLAWAIRHDQPQLHEIGLSGLYELVKKSLLVLQNSGGGEETAGALRFFQFYLLEMMKGVLLVLTDGMHKAGMRSQVKSLCLLLQVSFSGKVDSVGQGKEATLPALVALLAEGFPQMQKEQIEAFVLSLSSHRESLSDSLRVVSDFLIRLKSFSGHDLSVFEEEKKAALEVLLSNVSSSSRKGGGGGEEEEEAQDGQLKLLQAMVPGLVSQYNQLKERKGE